MSCTAIKRCLLINQIVEEFFSEYRWWLTGCSLFQQIKLIEARIGFGIDGMRVTSLCS